MGLLMVFSALQTADHGNICRTVRLLKIVYSLIIFILFLFLGGRNT